MSKKRILLKLTGTILGTNTFESHHLVLLANQIKQLEKHVQFGIVIGGGNIFRGNQHGNSLHIKPAIGHQVGMLATVMNGLLIHDIFTQHGLHNSVLSAFACPEIGPAISSITIESALKKQNTIIFTGGTGNPFFTTDTNAILRALQMNAQQVWKGTDVNGIYTQDPDTHPEAQLLRRVSYRQALDKKLHIMDATAFALAREYNQTIRVFNIFEKDALIQAFENEDFGSLVYTQD